MSKYLDGMMTAPRPARPFLEGGLRPYCHACGWRKGGVDSWDGRACKCGEQSPPMSAIADAHDDMAERAETMGDEVGSAFHATRASELRAAIAKATGATP